MNFKAIVLATAAVSVLPLISRADPVPPFGAASAYNLVALGTVNSNGQTVIAGTINDNADVTGRIAAADSISGSIDVGNTLNSDPWISAATVNGTTYDIVAPGGYNGSAVIGSHGDAYAPGALPSQFDFNGGGHLITTGSSPIDFDTLRTSLDAETAYLGALSATGSSCTGNCAGAGNPQWYVLTGTNSGLNVFNISGADFSSHQFDIVVPAGATVLINVDGTSDSLNQSLLINGQPAFSSENSSKILVNFPDATTVNAGAEFDASILAPFATVTGGSDFDGNIIAAAIGQTGEVHNIEFDGTLPTPPNTPAVPEPGTLALVGTGLLSVAGAARRKKASLKS